jgi:micrococcal nuclease
MRRLSLKKKDIGLIVLAVLALIYLTTGKLTPLSQSRKEPGVRSILVKNYDYSNVLIKRVVDGDTLVLENGQKVRLIGIDTPEMHDSNKLNRDAQRSGQGVEAIKKMGRQSYEFTKKLVEGKRVKLEFDVEKQDRYKRILAYAYLPDGTFVNAYLVQEGYASVMTYPPNVKHSEKFLRLYREARENKRGLWARP